MITIDGENFNVPLLSIKETADFLDKYAERTEDGVLQREIIGVYYNYQLTFGRPISTTDITEYANLWLKLTEPVPFHDVTVPDVNSTGDTLTFTAYFAGVSHEIRKAKPSAAAFWKNLTVNFISKSPSRTP